MPLADEGAEREYRMAGAAPGFYVLLPDRQGALVAALDDRRVEQVESRGAESETLGALIGVGQVSFDFAFQLMVDAVESAANDRVADKSVQAGNAGPLRRGDVGML